MKSIVSRWSPERLRIAICPDRVVVTRVGGLLRPRITHKQVVQCAGSATVPPWQAPLSAFAEILEATKAQNLSATIVLSNAFVRYAVVPWRDSVTSRGERLALARHCFKSTYGEMAAGWQVRLSDGGFRRNALASAIDGDLVTAIETLCREKRLTLSSVQPYFMAACNRFSREFKGSPNACLAVIDSGRVVVGIFDARGWQVLTTRRLAGDFVGALRAVLVQELQSANLAVRPEQIFILALEDPRVEFAFGNWATRIMKLKAQPGFSPLDDAPYAMALCGVA